MRYCVFYISLLFFVISCKTKEDIGDYKNSSLTIDIIDTLTTMNSLFDIEEVIIDNYIGNIRDFYIDKNDNIYILDREYILSKYDSKGKLIGNLDKIGRGPGEYSSITSFTVDDDENIYIDDNRQHKIKLYNRNLMFTKDFRKVNITPVKQITIFNNSIFLYCPFSNENSIYQYDINTGENIAKFGKADELHKKYKTVNLIGNMFFENNKLYYNLPNYYQIYEISENVTREILHESPTHFEQVNRYEKNPFKRLGTYSTLVYVFYEENLFFVITLPKKDKLNHKKNQSKCEAQKRYSRFGRWDRN